MNYTQEELEQMALEVFDLYEEQTAPQGLPF